MADFKGNGAAVCDAREERARRLFLSYRRNELLAPVRAIVESSQMLLEEPKVQTCEPFADDLRVIHRRAARLAEMIEDVLSPGRTAADVEASIRTLNHDLRNDLAIIIGYSEDLLGEAPRLFLDAFGIELEQIHHLGSRSLTLIDEIVAYLRGLDVPADDVAFVNIRALSDGLDGRPTAPSAAPGRVLVVDDDPESRASLSRRLAEQGHEVATAGDGVEALERIAAQPFDLVLLDNVMPRLNGFQVLERLKADPALRDVPVIMISGLNDLDAIVVCIELGAEDYLPKPFNRVLLRARVDACLEKKRLRDRAEWERRRYDELLHEILPGPIIDQLARSEDVKPTRHDDVAVLFADIVGFTPYCDGRPPETVVHHLQQLFLQWEKAAQAHRVQKIKTIGDAFMAAAGLLGPSDNPVLDCVRCGFEMIRATRAMHSAGVPIGWDLRVGVHIGPVVAGVLGRRQYLYDLWGDTVNTAARLESHGARGCVTLLAPSWECVAGSFRGESRSFCKIKGKGDAPIELIHLDPAQVETLPGA